MFSQGWPQLIIFSHKLYTAIIEQKQKNWLSYLGEYWPKNRLLTHRFLSVWGVVVDFLVDLGCLGACVILPITWSCMLPIQLSGVCWLDSKWPASGVVSNYKRYAEVQINWLTECKTQLLKIDQSIICKFKWVSLLIKLIKLKNS